FGVVPRPPPVLLGEMLIGEGGLRVLVQALQVRRRRRRVEVPVQFLDVLAVVALAVGQAEEALFQDGVLTVPQRRPQTEALAYVADGGEAVLAPAVGAFAGVLVRKEFPGVAVGGVVLAHGAPLPLADVRPPAPPVQLVGVLVHSLLFGAHEPSSP